jgi:hypothetical protein
MEEEVAREEEPAAAPAWPRRVSKKLAQEARRAWERIVPPGLYRHHKGYVCEVLALAARQSDGKTVVVYRYLDTGNVWEHEVSEFMAPAGPVPRFMLITPPREVDMAEFRRKALGVRAERATEEKEVETPGGRQTAHPGDWLVYETDSDRPSVMRHEDFERLFDPVDQHGLQMLQARAGQRVEAPSAAPAPPPTTPAAPDSDQSFIPQAPSTETLQHAARVQPPQVVAPARPGTSAARPSFPMVPGKAPPASQNVEPAAVPPRPVQAQGAPQPPEPPSPGASVAPPQEQFVPVGQAPPAAAGEKPAPAPVAQQGGATFDPNVIPVPPAREEKKEG